LKEREKGDRIEQRTRGKKKHPDNCGRKKDGNGGNNKDQK
jgi:hypothetical protein